MFFFHIYYLSYFIPTCILSINIFVQTEHDKEELLRNVFRKARRHAKDELAKQLSEFQVKRQVGLSALYAPDDAVLLRCMQDKDQVCEELLTASRCIPHVA